MQHFSRKSAVRSTLALAVLPFLGSGCAKSPSGGPTAPTAPNRLTINLQTQQPINNSYLYAFAFDDDDVSGDGPVAIVSTTTLANGVVGGSFTVLVTYQGGQYNVYRRTDLGNGAEQLDRASSAFVTPPSPANGSTLSFTLDLDAVTDTGVRLFNAGTQRLDVNFVTTNEIRRDPNDLRRKAFDAFGSRLASFYSTFDIRGTRTYTNSGTVQEPANDVQTDDTNNTINLAQLDITNFTITVQRQ